MPEVGWIGLGRMGEAMVTRLLQSGQKALVWNRTASKAEPVRKYGATVAGDIRELAACRAVFTMVSTTSDVEDVLFGPGKLLSGETHPKFIIDCSSISLDGSAEIRKRLEGMGIGYLCAPVSGNAKVCKAGKLSVVASGPKPLFDEAHPWLQSFGRSAIWVGEGELARIWKIAHNTFLGVMFESLCEITLMAERVGIPRHAFLESINNSVIGSAFTKYKTPTMVNLTFDQVTFTPKLLLKDMDLGLSAARAHGVNMPAAVTARESIAALVGRGPENIDFGALLLEIARNSGFEPKSENVPMSDGLEA